MFRPNRLTQDELLDHETKSCGEKTEEYFNCLKENN